MTTNWKAVALDAHEKNTRSKRPRFSSNWITR